MLLAIDIGNSLIKFALFDGTDLHDKFSIASNRDYRSDEFHFDRLKFKDGRPLKIDSVLVSSVVPELFDIVREASQSQFKVTPQFIDHNADFGLTINYDPPESIGVDRLINASAAAKLYGMPVIVCSFGTATVIDAVGKNGAFLGGIITPGMKTMAAALNTNAAQLPLVDIASPERLIGNSTYSSIQSGIVNGHIKMVDGLIQAFLAENSAFGNARRSVKVVATGGFANLIAPHIDAIKIHDENLTLNGLRLLADHSQ